MTLTPIAHMQSDFPEKFGIPRQSGIVPALRSTIVFTPEYRNPDALRGLEAFSHIWLVWGFSASVQTGVAATVRPPRLGGNVRLGVFATRSPFRPNPLGLSAVSVEGIALDDARGPVIHVRGADLLDGTPIYDLKPYLPYADCIPDAVGGFAADAPDVLREIADPDAFLSRLPPDKREALRGILALDPRPPYQRDPARVYGLVFAGFEVRFRVAGDVLTVADVVAL